MNNSKKNLDSPAAGHDVSVDRCSSAAAAVSRPGLNRFGNTAATNASRRAGGGPMDSLRAAAVAANGCVLARRHLLELFLHIVVVANGSTVKYDWFNPIGSLRVSVCSVVSTGLLPFRILSVKKIRTSQRGNRKFIVRKKKCTESGVVSYPPLLRLIHL